MATLDEILDYAMKRMTPEQRLRLGGPRDLFSDGRAESLYGGGLGLGGGIDRLGGTKATRPVVAGNSRTTVNVEAAPRAPAPVARPTDADEAAQVSQAGWAAANTALSPLLSDWRTSPAAALTAAIGGYGRGAYAAKQDIAAGAEKKAEAEAKAAQRKAMADAMASLPPEIRQKVMVLAGLGANEAAGNLIAPKPKDPIKLGDALLDPETLQPIAQAPAAQITPYQQAQLDIERAKFDFERNKPRGSEELVSIDTPEGAILVPRSQAVGKRPGSTRDLAGSEGEREDKRLLAIGAAVKQAGGWDGVSAEDRDWYEMKYRERAAPKTALDYSTGLMMQTTPDVSAFPLPMSLQPARPAASAAPVDGGESRASPDAPAQQSAAPSASLAYGPTAAARPLSSGPTKAQIDDYNASIGAKNDLMSATAEMRSLLGEGLGPDIMYGERAQKIKETLGRLTAAMGKANNVGVIAQGEYDRFMTQMSDPTSLSGWVKNASGAAPLTGFLDAMDKTATDRVANRAAEAGKNVVPPTDQRVPGTIYQLPKGPFRWTGTGWLPVAGN